MKTRYLFPPLFRLIGIGLAIPGFILGYFVVYQQYQIEGFGFQLRAQKTLFKGTFENFTNELALALVIIGLVFIAFSKIKKERLRLNALYWAMLINFSWYAAFIFLSFFNMRLQLPLITAALDGFADNILIYNFFTPLLIFIARFYYLVYRDQDGIAFTEVRLLRTRPFNIIGKWLSLILLVIMTVNTTFFDIKPVNNIYWALPLTLMIWLYSREKDEDEYIRALRFDAMHVAIYTNYAVILLSNFFIYGEYFLTVQMINFVTIPLIFQARFQYCLYRMRERDSRDKSILSLL